MSDRQKPDPRLHSAESPKQQAAASRETSRPADSVPVVSGQFANLPATFGRYQVEGLLGRGAMGAVYLARDTQLDRLVALKIPKVTASGSKKLLLRLETEAKAAAQLDHPSLCKVYDAGEINGQCFIAMQYIEGETLKSQLDLKSKSVAEAVSLIVQLAEGLSEAHALGIIHRDLKPENIMINRRGLPVVMDFGLAKFSTISSNAKATQAGTILGSPAYMSPEQASGTLQEIDQRSDLYALGIILFEMLTGELPFGGSAMQILGQKSILEAASPLILIPDLSPRLAAICHKMIAKKNADRYQTLTEVLTDLKGIDLSLTAPVIDVASVEANPFSNFVASVQPVERTARATKRQALSAQRPRSSRPVLKTRFHHVVAWWKGQSLLMRRTSLGGAAFLLLCGVIIITIKAKDGTQLKFEVPDTSTVTLSTDVRKPKKRTAAQTKQVPELTPADSRNDVAGWHGWPADAPPPAIAPFDSAQAKKHQHAWADYLKLPIEYTNTVGMKFVLIPPGEFTMGSPTAEIEAALQEVGEDKGWQEIIKSQAPQHKVILTQAIYLGANEVTQKEYGAVMNATPSHFASTGSGKGAVANLDTQNHPVETVSWNDAAEFCAKLSQKEELKAFYFRAGEVITLLDGTGYRLPTEAEWEFACRAGTTTKYWTGDTDDELLRAAWFKPNSGGRTHAAGELKANPFGLYDIHGNVWEWVDDSWDPLYYSRFLEKSAVNPSRPSSASNARVMRGGNWGWPASNCRSADHNTNDSPFRFITIGFRVSLLASAVKDGLKRRADVKETGPIGEQTGTAPLTEAFIGIKNGDFSDGLNGWQKEGNAADFKVFPLRSGEKCLTTHNGRYDAQGRLFQSFEVPGDATQLEFFVHGGNSAKMYVGLIENEKVIYRVTGKNSNDSSRVAWDVSKLRGKQVTLEIVDHLVRRWGHIGVYGFNIRRDTSLLTK